MKQFIKALLCIASAFVLCACSGGGVPITQNNPPVTLPPASVRYVAPIGDAALEYTETAALYLPRHDGTRLGTINSGVSFSLSRPNEESLVRALLASPGDGVLSSIGGGVKLSLYGSTPVEVSRDVATVNLSATALQLDRQSFYTAAQAITATICSLKKVNYVNLLVMDKPVGMDIGNTIPMGTLSRNAWQELTASYEHLLSRREGSLSSNVTLYFPVTGSHGFMSEVRVCSFPSRDPSDMITAILRELAAGSSQGISTSLPPLLGDILTKAPTLSDSEEAGGKIIELSFDYSLDDMLEAYLLDRAQCLAAVCCTLCTFFPNVAGIQFTIGDKPVSTLMLTDEFGSSVTFENGIARRSDFTSLILDERSLYFSGGNQLIETKRPMPYYSCQNPRALIIELAKGAQSYDSVSNLLPIMPASIISDSDILGLAIDDQTLLINMARSFESICAELEPESERILAYSIVNTLCENDRIKEVCFFIAGNQVERLAGGIYWSGFFYPMRYYPYR